MFEISIKPLRYKSKITGNEYNCDEYLNHGNVIPYRGFKDLPAEEYPYSIIYEDANIPIWMKNS